MRDGPTRERGKAPGRVSLEMAGGSGVSELVSALAEQHSVQLRAEQCAERGNVKPDQRRNSRTERSVEDAVIGDARYVPSESQCCRQPHHAGCNRSRHDVRPMFPAPGSEVIE